jgi:hypothetical protein
MTDKTIYKVEYYKVNFFQSIVMDIWMVGLLMLPLYLNQVYLGGKWYIDIFFIWLALSQIYTHFNTSLYKRFKDEEALMEYLKQKNNE